MRDDSDAEVWQRVLQGSSAEFGVVWDRHRDRIFRHLITLGNSPSDAEDLTAVVFLELWRRREAARLVEESLAPWLIVTAQNVARNAARSRRRHRALLAKIPPAVFAPDPADIVGERDNPRVRRAREILSLSRQEDRHLAVLTAIEGFTVAEAAAAVGISEPAARMRLSRLRSRLAEATSTPELQPEGGS